MKSHALSRSSFRQGARHWHRELERLGVPTVRKMYCEHDMHRAEEPAVVLDIPSEFVRDWLAFHDRRAAPQQSSWRASVFVLGVVG